MKLTAQEYEQLANETSRPTRKVRNCVVAFVVGGLICTLGQAFYALFEHIGLTDEQVKMAVPVVLIGLGAALTGLKIYNRIAKHAGAGTIVPITGFANAIVAPAIEFKSEGHILGIGAKMFVIAGPVLVFGITASVVYGLVLCLIKFF